MEKCRALSLVSVCGFFQAFWAFTWLVLHWFHIPFFQYDSNLDNLAAFLATTAGRARLAAARRYLALDGRGGAQLHPLKEVATRKLELKPSVSRDRNRVLDYVWPEPTINL